MRKLFTLIAAGAIVLRTSAASAAILPVTASLDVAIGSLPPAGFTGSAPAASSAGNGGAATLPAGAISGIFQTVISPPLIVIGGIGVAAPGLVQGQSFPALATDAVNQPLSWDGSTGTMSLDASAYLLDGTATNVLGDVPLAVVGVGGTQMFHALTLVGGTVFANPYQLGMVTLMGALNGAPHTVTGTGVDNRTANGAGTLVLVSPTNVSLGVLGSLAAVATLTLTYVPEPGTLLLLGVGVAGLAAVGRKRMA